MENKEEKRQDEVITAIKEEYEKKLDDLRKELDEKKQAEIKELEAKHIAQIRALMTGREEYKKQKEEEENENLVERLIKKYGGR